MSDTPQSAEVDAQAQALLNLRHAMEEHLRQGEEALAMISWDRLDTVGTIMYAQAHAAQAHAIAAALQLTMLNDALHSNVENFAGNIPDMLRLMMDRDLR